MTRSGSAACIAACMLATALLASCDGNDYAPSPSGAPAPPSGIGPSGGTVNGPNGASVVIPAGALTANAAIAVQLVASGAPPLPAGVQAAGAIYAFTPHGQTFAQPVTVSIPIDAAKVQAGNSYKLYKTANGVNGPWEPIAGTTITGNMLTAQVTSFSFVLGNVGPAIVQQPPDATVQSGDAASFTVQATGTPPLTYTLQRLNGTTPTDVDTTQTVGAVPPPVVLAAPVVTTADDGVRFRIIVSNLEGIEISRELTLTVTPLPVPPSINSQPQSAAVQAGQTATFTVAAAGTGPLAYQWRRSTDGGSTFADIAGATGASFTTPATSVADDGHRFLVVVSNPVGSATSQAVTLSVTPAPTAPAITQQPANAGVQEGASAIFSVIASGTAPLGYQWERSSDGGTTFGAIGGATGASYTLPAAAATDDGAQFRVTVTNVAGSATSNVAALAVAPAPTLVSAASLAAGQSFSIARLADRSLRSWGQDGAGELGAGNGDQSRNVPGTVLASNVSSIASGAAHSLAVRGTGEVMGWGYNGFGQLGLGDNLSRSAPATLGWQEGGVFVTNVDAAAACGGSLHSLILRNTGQVRAMGYNVSGQLGDGSTMDRNRAVVVSGIDGSGNNRATAIACGANHSLALMQDGTVRAWGSNQDGQLGAPSSGVGTASMLPVPVDNLGNVIAIAAGSNYSLALRDDRSVWAWGSNNNGKLGDGTELARSVATPTLLTSGIVQIAAGGEFSLALRLDGVVASWGINETGQLGIGSLSPGYRETPGLVPQFCPGAGNGVVEIAVGNNPGLEHALARCADGTVWAWGYNAAGQLGNGSPNTIFASPVQVAGLTLN